MIEDSFETTKNELGLDHNETRSWNGWHRHISLVMLAFAMMNAIRHHANATPLPKNKTPKDDFKGRQDRTAIDPLVGPGNPPHRHPPCPKTDQPRSRHCMVRLASAHQAIARKVTTSNGICNCNEATTHAEQARGSRFRIFDVERCASESRQAV